MEPIKHVITLDILQRDLEEIPIPTHEECVDLIEQLTEEKALLTPEESDTAARRFEKEIRSDYLTKRIAFLQRIDKERARLTEKAQRVGFTVRKPSYKELLAWRGEAQKLNEETGEVNFDRNLFRLRIAEKCLLSPTADEISSPNIAEALVLRIERSIAPSEERLFFSS